MHIRHLMEKGKRHLGESLSPPRGGGDEAYLSYYDVRLFREDVNSIKDDDWLTDNAISFWQEVLEREDLKGYPKASIVLLRPTMSYLLMQTPDPITLKEALPNFSTTTHVFLPVNDNRDVTKAEGGSHWTLLLVSIIDGVAFHYDSMHASNEREARSTTMKLEQLLGKRLRFIPMLDAPQQENGSDCGVFVCILMKHLLLKRLLRADASKKISMSMKDAHINARDGRRTMLRVIEEKRQEGERRRSRSHSPFRPHSAHSRSPPRVGEENAMSSRKTSLS
ncbi:cysteine proteinase [Dothidotthia symphoricarpi CBS 119687]|uniref:Cysteine proteinase n=1 Tax=Dothidotthia symphoricarpi CBS 119687 TaxID=1392245 RepID=A0A6A6ATZ3_9PLEO|nr:cysteine proteinase [Dothidotthia symphoricarpi CBS 119687]KAF2134021.1 cysteine proteinase [Dothidotthia symphoricarpi CBS 119687]